MREHIAFLDLVGVKDVLSVSPTLYASRIVEFHSILGYNLPTLEKRQRPITDCQVFVFSDCCFIRSKDLSNLINYLRGIRRQCYSSLPMMFFKGAIVSGALEAVACGTKKQTQSGSLHGYSFGKDAVRGYICHEQLKAIGLYCEKKLLGSNDESPDYIKNFYIPNDRKTLAATFLDLSHSHKQNRSGNAEYEGINLRTVEHARTEFHRASLRSSKLARYYPPIFGNWVQSVDLKLIFSKKTFSLGSNDLLKLSDNSPWAVFNEICSKKFWQEFNRVPGVRLLYLMVLAKFYSAFTADYNKDSEEWKLKDTLEYPQAVEDALDFICGLSGLQSEMETAPREIFHPFFRNVFHNQVVDIGANPKAVSKTNSKTVEQRRLADKNKGLS